MYISFVKFVTYFILITIISVSAGPMKCPPMNPTISSALPKRYIVIVSNETLHYNWLKGCYNRSVQGIETTKVPNDRKSLLSFSVEGKLFGYTTWYHPEFVENTLSKRSETILVEKNSYMSINHCVEKNKNKNKPPRSKVQPNPPFNLDRIDQADFPLNQKYTFPSSAGSNATVYVVDTYVF